MAVRTTRDDGEDDVAGVRPRPLLRAVVRDLQRILHAVAPLHICPTMARVIQLDREVREVGLGVAYYEVEVRPRGIVPLLAGDSRRPLPDYLTELESGKDQRALIRKDLFKHRFGPALGWRKQRVTAVRIARIPQLGRQLREAPRVDQADAGYERCGPAASSAATTMAPNLTAPAAATAGSTPWTGRSCPFRPSPAKNRTLPRAAAATARTATATAVSKALLY